jgi:hypothetical protein
MKNLLILLLLTFLAVSSLIMVIAAAPAAEYKITGEWKEMNWEYEKVDGSASVAKKGLISEEVKNKIGQHLVIHTAESWEFLPNHQLKLITAEGTKTVYWFIKGRGHILQLKYGNNKTENYNISRLSGDTLTLNFETKIQARGIAKLTFRRK